MFRAGRDSTWQPRISSSHLAHQYTYGIPRKNRAASSPAAFFVAEIQHTTVPKPHMMSGKYRLPEIFFISRFDGIKSKVTTDVVPD